MADEPQRQIDKFKQAAPELETGDDPRRLKERLEMLLKHQPAEKPE
jgi:hypothetical protein